MADDRNGEGEGQGGRSRGGGSQGDRPQDGGSQGGARSRVAATQAAQHAAELRRRRLIIVGCVVVVIAILIGVGLLVGSHKSASDNSIGSGPLVTPSGAVAQDGLAIPYGADPAAKVTLTIYEDFRCPVCKAVEGYFESIYKPLADDGKIRVQYHIVNLIDRNDGGTGSLRAGIAAVCAQNEGRFEPYHDVLFANQPDETDDAYSSTSKLISLAGQVNGLTTPAFEACVNATTFGPWVISNYNALNTILGGYVATPYYAINGKQYKITGQSPAAAQAAFTTALNTAVAAAG